MKFGICFSRLSLWNTHNIYISQQSNGRKANYSARVAVDSITKCDYNAPPVTSHVQDKISKRHSRTPSPLRFLSVQRRACKVRTAGCNQIYLLSRAHSRPTRYKSNPSAEDCCSSLEISRLPRLSFRGVFYILRLIICARIDYSWRDERKIRTERTEMNWTWPLSACLFPEHKKIPDKWSGNWRGR